MCSQLSFYPAICRAVRPPPQNSAEGKKLGEGSTKPPLIKVSLYFVEIIFCISFIGRSQF
ncbi:hypothetical protein COM56_01275 [Bacillus cereus]|nr:hypothetical protein COM56_01275 [Bacillus cereus]